MKRAFLFLLLAVLLLATTPVKAEWITTTGEFSFGPSVAEEEACRRAERRAKDNALKQAQGERLASDDMLVCKEKETQANCDINRFTWSTINGLILGLRNIERKTSHLSGEYRTCSVTMDVNVETAKGDYDPGFDLAVQLNEKLFKNGDIMELTVQPTKAMYVYVFQWLPYEQVEKQVTKVFPNFMDRDHHFVSPGTVPTPRGKENYDMTVSFPEGLKTQERLVDEYLLIVATSEDIAFRDSYTLEEFNQRLLEIPRSRSRLIKRAYMVAKP